MIEDVLRARDIRSQCPLCGRDVSEAPHTEEHIFPGWLQQHHDLLNRRLTIPNLIGKTYKTVKIGICAHCNNETFSRLETRISRALTSAHPFVEARGLDRDDVAAWIGKILWLNARKSNSVQDHRTRHKTKPEQILPSALLPGLLYTGMLLRCFAHGKLMRACHVDDPSMPLRLLGPAYSLYIHEIDRRDDRFESFDFVDNSLIAGAAIRSGDVGMICLFDGGLHARFLSDRYSYLDGHPLHPMQFNELTARIFYDQTLLDPPACRVTYYWNEPLNAIFAETSGSADLGPYRRDLHDPALLARMLGFYTCQEPEDLLFEDGRTFTALQRPDESFMPFAVTPEEIETARRTPGNHRVATAGDSIRVRLAEEARAAHEAGVDGDEGQSSPRPVETARSTPRRREKPIAGKA
ncbi:MAG: hypothetical protein ABSF67_00810 [Roseiarcus sp.]